MAETFLSPIPSHGSITMMTRRTSIITLLLGLTLSSLPLAVQAQVDAPLRLAQAEFTAEETLQPDISSEQEAPAATTAPAAAVSRVAPSRPRPAIRQPSAEELRLQAELQKRNAETLVLQEKLRKQEIEDARYQKQKRLEAEQAARLAEEANRAESGTDNPSLPDGTIDATEPLAGTTPEVPSGTDDESSGGALNWILAGLAAFACALCIILLLRMNQHRSDLEIESEQVEPVVASHLALDESGLDAAAESDPVPVEQPSIVHTIPEWDVASPALHPKAAAVKAQDERVQAYDSTIELADIMLSFGRVNSAADALATYIENYPQNDVAPWLKLLEVYRESGQRAEFDKIAGKLNKTFNVWTVGWENFESARDPVYGLESVEHVVDHLQEIWGTRECQGYLQYLLRDTREETRKGFSLTAIDDILCLNAILERDLGPYTGPIDSFTKFDAGPRTETDENFDPQAFERELNEHASAQDQESGTRDQGPDAPHPQIG